MPYAPLRSRPRPSLSRLASALALGVLLVLPGLGHGNPADAELDEKAWSAARKEARRLMNAPGVVKDSAIDAVAKDDSERAATLLVKWVEASRKLEKKTLRPERDEAKEKFDKLVKLLLKAYDKMPPRQAEHRQSYNTLKAAYDKAQAALEAEHSAQRSLGHAFASLTRPEAIDHLLEKGEKKVRKAKGPSVLLMGIIKAYLGQPKERIQPRLLRILADKSVPEGRILILNWIANVKALDALDAVVACLKGPEDAVRRSAVFTLEVLDDPRCVKPLIDAMAKADGLLLQELEATLHYFTGQTFDESHKIWMKWWKAEGAAWLENVGDERHEKRTPSPKGGTTTFYGVETKSKRIVFVLDRSGSMDSPASEASKNPTKPRGPVTGEGKDGKDGEDPEIRGDTKMEVAKNQLAWSLKSLPKDVHFNVVFYSSQVEAWQQPPSMHRATPDNKEAATAWFMEIKAQGSTRLFDAMLKALEYAVTEGGADTIFVLSDGSPTIVGGGGALKGEALEAEYAAFTEANKIYKCVVHTIGVGPKHNRTLMRRIAHDTGGTYKGVGDK